MNTTTRPRTVRATALLLAVLGSSTITGCGIGGAAGAETESTTPAVTESVNSTAAGLVPADIKKRGSITVVTDVTFPPFGFLKADGKTMTGIDIDTVEALKPLLGIDIKVVSAGFDAFIPGLQSGRYDAGFNAITNTPDRRKIVDFVDFNQYGGYFLTQPGSPLTITSYTSACEVTVGAEKGSDVVQLLEDLTPVCAKESKGPVDLKIFGSQAEALVALSSGRVQAVLSGSTAGYNAERSNGKYEVNGPLLKNLGGEFDQGGLALPKDSTLTDAMVAGLKELYTNGTLSKIYQTYGINDELLIEPHTDEN